MSDENTTPDTVPLDKYNRKSEELRKANERIKELEPLAARVPDLEAVAAKVPEYETRLAALTSEHSATLSRLTEDLAMADVGLTDPLGRDTVRLVYGRLPEKDRPALGDYVRGLTAEGAEVPKPLQPYFTRATPAESPPRNAAPPPRNAAPPATPGADGSNLLKLLEDAQREFRRTGNAQVLADADKRFQEAMRARGGRP